MERWYDVFESLEFLDVEILYKLKEYEKKPELIIQYFHSLYGMNQRSNEYIRLALLDAKERLYKKKNENKLKNKIKTEQKNAKNELKLQELYNSLDKLNIGEVLEYYSIVDNSGLLDVSGFKTKCKDMCYESRAAIIKKYGSKVNILLDYIKSKFNDRMPKVIFGIYGNSADAYPSILVKNVMKEPSGLEYLKSIKELNLL